MTFCSRRKRRRRDRAGLNFAILRTMVRIVLVKEILPLRLLAASLLCWFATLFAFSASAGPVGGTENVRASLILETVGLKPGAAPMAALRLEMREGWHSYWINPGDSGMETTIEWVLPAGVTAGAIQWPTPERIPVGPLVNYGYGHDALLLVPLNVDRAVIPGQPVTLTAKAAWLACADVCIPEEATLTLDLPVLDAPGASPEAALIAAARAALPTTSPWKASVARVDQQLRLSLAATGLDPKLLTEAYFFPTQNGAVQAAAAQTLAVTPRGLTLTLAVGDLPPAPGAALDGVLVLTEKLGQGTARNGTARNETARNGTARNAFLISATPAAAPPASEAPAIGFGLALLLAFAGGIILNLMPCVLPILAMKAMSFARHGAEPRQGLAYTAGVLACFLGIAGLLLALRAGGAQIGWGYQLQAPIMVAAMAVLVFAVGLSFSGVLSFGAGLASVGGGLAGRGGLTGSFFTGALAVVVATPCTAPFMGAALGFALVQPPVEALLVFAALGAGMAAPFLLLSMTPAFGRLLPKPGVWMDRLKQFLAFPMYATATWLVWVLSLQAGSDALLATMIAMVLIGFAAWAHGATELSEGKWRLAGRGMAAFGVLAALYLLQGLPSGSEPNGAEPARAEGPLAMKVGAVSWEAYAPETLAAARASDRPVLLNVTAAWCITCLVNEKVALSSPKVAAALGGSGVVALKADWTRRDPGITALLAEFGRNGVPLYALYPAKGRAAELLPQILTEADVIAAIGRLAPAS